MQVWATLGNYGQLWGNSWATPGRIYGPTLGLVYLVSDRYVFYFQFNFYENWKKVNMVIINLTNSAQKRVLVKWQGQKNLYCDRSIRGSYLFLDAPRISIRGFVRPSVRWSVGPLVRWSVGPSRFRTKVENGQNWLKQENERYMER